MEHIRHQHHISFHSVRLKPLIISLVIPFAAGVISMLLTGDIRPTYAELVKPSFAPPPWIFPTVWTILFLLMGISCYMIYQSGSSQRGYALVSYGVQLAINSLWTLFFFRLKLFLFSFAWLGILMAAVFVMLVYFYRIKPAAAYLQIPYVLWLIFAAVLNICIYFLN